MKSGAADYISKREVSAALLERTIRYAIERKRVDAERERLLRQLEAEHARLSTIISNAPVALFVASREGQVILANQEAERLFGPALFDAQASRQSTSRFLHPDGTQYLLHDLPFYRSATEGETHINLEIILPVQENACRYLLVNSAPIIERNGQVTGAVGMAQDITARKLAEVELQKAHAELELRVQERTQDLVNANNELIAEIAERKRVQEMNANLLKDLEKALEEEQVMRQRLILAEKHAAMSRMMASVAHEINNPVQTIQNCLYLTQQDLPENSPIHEYLEMSQSETKRISRLVDQLRQIYRPNKAGPLVPINLAQILSEVQALLTHHLNLQNVIWRQNDTAPRIIVNGFADQIKEVIINIILNACEAMQPQGGELFVSYLFSKNGEEVGIRLKDTGPGIPREDLPKLFEPFYTTKDNGTGLGLPICFEIIQRHAGHIDAESDLGQGATFTIWLPVCHEEGNG